MSNCLTRGCFLFLVYNFTNMFILEYFGDIQVLNSEKGCIAYN